MSWFIADVESPHIVCPANLTVYTDCLKNFSTVFLPNLDSVFDNSGTYTIGIDVEDSQYQVGDVVTFHLATEPHVVRYTATDDSLNRGSCDLPVYVSSVSGK